MKLSFKQAVSILFAPALVSLGVKAVEPDYTNRNVAPHHYLTRTLGDPFTLLKEELESGRIPLDRGSEKAFLLSLLQALEVPATSQMLVFSTTSLQLSLISPSNPRALYFNEEIYVGYIPGGRIEIISLDPELGAIFYIFDIPRGQGALNIERSGRCMNCHSGPGTGRIPGLVIKSVVPGPGGGTLDAFRVEETGHTVPLEERFGGWYLTGNGRFTNHWANLIGRLSPDGLSREHITPGERFEFARYPYELSDLLPQLIHEHQAGFVNRVVEASYRVRTALHASNDQLSEIQAADLKPQAGGIVRYLLFAEEAALPGGGIAGDTRFIVDFQRNERKSQDGRSLKELDLRTRLFRYRCSYMIYSGVFMGMPAPLRQEVYRQLKEALRTEDGAPEFAYLPALEKLAIRRILGETMAGLPADW